MESINDSFNEFESIYSLLEPPKEYQGRINTEYQNESSIDFLDNSDRLNNYSSFQIEFPGLSSPSQFNNFISSFQNPFDFTYSEELYKNDSSNGQNSSMKFNDRKQFVETMYNAYRDGLQQQGLDPNYALALVAQDAIETDYGKKVLGNYNYGNITTNGDDWHKQTGERKWKDFNSLKDYVEYKIKFLSNNRYRYFQTFSPNSNIATSMQVLANRGYDPGNPKYGKLVESVYKDVSNLLKSPNKKLVNIDIEDLLKQEGITSINGKAIKFGSREKRSNNASYGVTNSHHKEIDPSTGYANARDISIVGGTDKDYSDLRAKLLNNTRIRDWMEQKGWGILNELTPEIMNKTRATGRHFHLGPDKSARRTWLAWLNNPNVNVTQLF